MARQHPFAHRVTESESLSVTTSNNQSGTCPFGATISQIRTHGTSGSPLNFYKIGNNPVATTDGTSSFVHDGDSEHMIVRPDSFPGANDGEKIAAICTSGTATLFIDWMES
tara:strand:+ start:794 stop:1126 length:333 start_codon:yes stop_codon:yes gene_type:complete